MVVFPQVWKKQAKIQTVRKAACGDENFVLITLSCHKYSMGYDEIFITASRLPN